MLEEELSRTHRKFSFETNLHSSFRASEDCPTAQMARLAM